MNRIKKLLNNYDLNFIGHPNISCTGMCLGLSIT